MGIMQLIQLPEATYLLLPNLIPHDCEGTTSATRPRSVLLVGTRQLWWEGARNCCCLQSGADPIHNLACCVSGSLHALDLYHERRMQSGPSFCCSVGKVVAPPVDGRGQRCGYILRSGVSGDLDYVNQILSIILDHRPENLPDVCMDAV